jgi:hypothetical protein
MLFCPVIWPNDTVVCYPFNRTLLDPSQPESLRKSVATYLGSSTTAALVTRPVKCPIDFQTGLPIPGVCVPQGFYLMWARPLTRNDASSEKDSLYTTNDLASDLLEYGNRTRNDWCSRVEAARSGKQGVFIDTVVTGPAVLFYRDPKDGKHASVDIDWIIWNKMGNAGSWFDSGSNVAPSSSPPPLVVSESVIENPPIVENEPPSIPAYIWRGEPRSQRPITTEDPVEYDARIKEVPFPPSTVAREQQQTRPDADDADDPLAGPLVTLSPPPPPAAVSNDEPPSIRDGFLLILRPEAASNDNKTPQTTETSVIPSSSTLDMPPESSPKRRKRTTPITVTEKTIYQTRRRSGIQKVNPRYAK